MERKVFFTLIHKRDFTGIKQVDGFEFSIKNIEFYGYVDTEKKIRFILLTPKLGEAFMTYLFLMITEELMQLNIQLTA